MIPSFVAQLKQNGGNYLINLIPKLTDGKVNLETAVYDEKTMVINHYFYEEKSQSLMVLERISSNKALLHTIKGLNEAFTQELSANIPSSEISFYALNGRMVINYFDSVGNLQLYNFQLNKWGYVRLNLDHFFKTDVRDPISQTLFIESDSALYLTKKHLHHWSPTGKARIELQRSSFIPVKYYDFYVRSFRIGKANYVQVDHSSLTSGMLKTYKIDDEALNSSIQNAYKIPEACNVQSPKETLEGISVMHLECSENDELLYYEIPVK